MLNSEDKRKISSYPLKLLFLSFLLIIAGVTVLVVASFSEGNSVSIGGVLLVGPIPIVLGAGPYSSILIIVVAVLTIVALAVFVWIRKQASKA